MRRDEFDLATKETLAKRVNSRCSNPDCRRGTCGPRDDRAKAVNVGVAAHVSAASPGGPRYDSSLSRDERCDIGNGIWLCQTCAKLIDNDAARYTAGLLRGWKTAAEKRALDEIVRPPATSELRVRAVPTRIQRRQLAHFQLFNGSSEPIYIKGWYASWGPTDDPRLISSVECLKGSLPARIRAHDAYDFMVPLDSRGVDALTGLGVEDGTGRRWSLSDDEIQGFVRAAVVHRLPPPVRVGPADSDLAKCTVEIVAHAHQLPSGGPTLRIEFKNVGPLPIPLRGAQVRWRYDPPRVLSGSDKPTVLETEASVETGAGRPRPIVPAEGQHQFVLAPEFAQVLVAVLSPDVPADAISVEVLGGDRLRWSEFAGVASAVREVAQSIVSSWDS